MKNMFKLFGIVTILIVSIFVTFGCSNVASASDFQFEVVSSGLKITNYTTTPHFFVPVKHFVFSLSGAKKRQLPRTLNDMPIIISENNEWNVLEVDYE